MSRCLDDFPSSSPSNIVRIDHLGLRKQPDVSVWKSIYVYHKVCLYMCIVYWYTSFYISIHGTMSVHVLLWRWPPEPCSKLPQPRIAISIPSNVISLILSTRKTDVLRGATFVYSFARWLETEYSEGGTLKQPSVEHLPPSISVLKKRPLSFKHLSISATPPWLCLKGNRPHTVGWWKETFHDSTIHLVKPWPRHQDEEITPAEAIAVPVRLLVWKNCGPPWLQVCFTALNL